MTSLTDFVASADIRFTATPTDANPAMDNSQDTSHWRCVLRRGSHRFTVTFSMGAALVGPPTLEDVLDCVALDVVGYENAHHFGEWCMDYGYDTDSRRAESTYKLIGRQAASLKRLLDPTQYSDLLWNVERA